MGNTVTTISISFQVLSGIGARILFGWSPTAWLGDSKNKKDVVSPPINIPSFLKDSNLVSELKKNVFTPSHLEKLSKEQLVKICRQLEFWYSEQGGNLKNQPNQEMVQLGMNLVDKSLWYRTEHVSRESKIKVPKVRFGKTELQISVITCGGMRFHSTWLPDTTPIVRPSRKTVLTSSAHNNLKNCIRACLALGINHFETARMYGTSEYEIADALYELIQEGEIKREDFIIQTKLKAAKTNKFIKSFDQSWQNIGEKLGCIDLVSLHGIYKWCDDIDESLAVLDDLKKVGKVR